MENILNNKIVLIGSGNIAPSHIEAAQANGFELFGICSSDNSQTALNLANKYSFKNYFPTLEKMLETEFDAAAIVCNTSNLPIVYEKLSKKNVPILVEKPYSVNIEDFKIEMLSNKNLLIGYNRRYYSSIQALKDKLNSESFYYAIVEISEISWNSDSNKTERENAVLENSVHMLDLILYLFGNFESIAINRSVIEGNLVSICARMTYMNESVVELKIFFGIPLNNSISVRFKDSVVECKPIEIYASYTEMKMIPANSQVKFKRYQPTSYEAWTLSDHDSNYKPGFYLQYREFLGLISRNPIRIGATPNQALEVLKFSQRLLGLSDEI